MEMKLSIKEQASKLILHSFQILEREYDYKHSYKNESSDIFLEYLIVDFEQNEFKRKVSVSYTKGIVSNKVKFTFSVTISRVPHNGWKDMISIREYLKYKNKSIDTSIVEVFSSKAAKDILDKLSKLLVDEFEDVLVGKAWYDNYYPSKD